MDIKTLKQSLPYMLEAKLTPWLVGHHAKGKSQVIKQYCNENDYKLFDFRLGTQADVGDILGLADFQRNDKGELVATQFFMPDWLRDMIEFCEQNPDKKGIAFFDEINRAARKDLLSPVFQMALDHRLHTTPFPDNLHIIVASNPDTQDYDVLTIGDKAFNSRFIQVKFEPTKNEWFEFAKELEFDDSFMGFLKEQPEFLEQDELEDFSMGDMVQRDRRAWSGINELIKVNTPQDLLLEIAKGLIGMEAVVAWRDYLNKGEKPVEGKDVIERFSKVKDRLNKIVNQNRNDIIKHTSDSVIEYLKNHEKALSPQKTKNLKNFLKVIPPEQSFAAARDLVLIDNAREALDGDDEIYEFYEKIKGQVDLDKIQGEQESSEEEEVSNG